MTAVDVETRPPVLITIGNPNTGKSTLFNALTGMCQKVGNFPGVTVEHVRGEVTIDGTTWHVVDLPGTYSLAAQSPDEMVAIDVLLGHERDVGQPDAVVIVVDANNLRRNLFLASQVIELAIPVVVALNMMDVADKRGVDIDANALQRELGVPVVPMCAARGDGLDALHTALAAALGSHPAPRPAVDPELRAAALELCRETSEDDRGFDVLEMERALIDAGGYAEQRVLERVPSLADAIIATREALGQGRSLAAIEARNRYRRINEIVSGVERRPDAVTTTSDRIDKVVNHPVLGSALFILTMAIVFQSVFAWTAPVMDGIDAWTSALAARIDASVEAPLIASFLGDGVVAGVGSVIIFLPQIIVLFAFIIILEDTGYMARAAFLMDRLMRWCGLSGQSFIPMLSSFACAVPGIMGTRVIPNRRDRIATILAAPFMTCSARLPVYALLIAAFVPSTSWFGGWLNLQGLVLLGFYLFGIVAGVVTAYIVNKTLLRGPAPTFLLELPPYRRPNVRSMLVKLWGRSGIFLKRAGTVIFAVAVIVWFLATFPLERTAPEPADEPENIAAVSSLDDSYLARMAQTVVPVTAPLGWDWKITAAVIASFPAREVVIAVLGTLYAIDVDDEGSLIDRIRTSRHPDGRTVFTLPVALGLMVFYALCLQCAATIAVMRRETNTWRWPAFAWFYMTSLGYAAALLTYRAGTYLMAA